MKNWKDWPIKIYVDKESGKKLYFRGDWSDNLFEKSITIVGSRRMTKYGADVVRKLVPQLVSRQISVISGFMYGVDTCCHKECLDNGGRTIAVVGGGLNQISNSYNDGLYSSILENNGVVISEYEPEFKPTVWTFPQRDKLMAALSTLGVLVIEGGIKSGSLITARYAQKYNKSLMAIPGPISSLVSEGTNWLIKSGAARMVTEIADIFPEEGENTFQGMLYRDYSHLDNMERNIIQILENEALTIDEICRKLKAPVVTVTKTISMLSMRDLVEEVGGKIYLG